MADREIGLFKLITGEEVLAEYVTDEDQPEYYLLKAPRRVFLAQVGPNQLGVKIAPWIVASPEGMFPIHSSHVLTVSVAISEDLKNGYLGETSGLDLSAATTAKKLVI